MRVRIATAAILCCLLAAGTAGAAPGTSASGHRLPRPSASAPRPAHPHRPRTGATTRSSSPAGGPARTRFCWTPGEPAVAVGPSDVLETVNTVATVYSKSPARKLAEFDFSDFFGPPKTSAAAIRAPSTSRASNGSHSAAPASARADALCDLEDEQPGRRMAGTSTKRPTRRRSTRTRSRRAPTSSSSPATQQRRKREWIYVYNLSQLAAGVTQTDQVVKAAGEEVEPLRGGRRADVDAPPVYLVASYPRATRSTWRRSRGTPAESNVALKEQPIKVDRLPGPAGTGGAGRRGIGGGDLDGRIYDAVYEHGDVRQQARDRVLERARVRHPRPASASARIDLSGTKPVLSQLRAGRRAGLGLHVRRGRAQRQGPMFEAYTRSNADPRRRASAVIGPGFDVTSSRRAPARRRAKRASQHRATSAGATTWARRSTPVEPIGGLGDAGSTRPRAASSAGARASRRCRRSAFALPTVTTGAANRQRRPPRSWPAP